VILTKVGLLDYKTIITIYLGYP